MIYSAGRRGVQTLTILQLGFCAGRTRVFPSHAMPSVFAQRWPFLSEGRRIEPLGCAAKVTADFFGDENAHVQTARCFYSGKSYGDLLARIYAVVKTTVLTRPLRKTN
jgi:hypothetical protein